MGTKHLIDTNIIIYLLNGSLPQAAIALLMPIIDDEYFISIVSKMEVLGFEFATPADDIIAENFIEESNLLHLTEEIIKTTISLRKIVKIKLPDAIIAATALTYNLTLVSRNDKDFSKVPNLLYINPFYAV